MKNKLIKIKYDLAIEDLSYFIVSNYAQAKFMTASKTTNNYDKFVAETVNNDGIMTISTEGCNDTIYPNSAINILARYWHDKIHFEQHLDFGQVDETVVACIQKHEVYNYILNKTGNAQRAYCASLLIYLDIKGQVDYYAMHKKFVDNQSKFVKELFYKHFKKL